MAWNPKTAAAADRPGFGRTFATTLLGASVSIAAPTSPAAASPFIDDLGPALQRSPGIIRTVLQTASDLRVQILIAEVVERRGDRAPRLRRFGYRVDAEYFYPASAIKLCAAVAALQTLDELERQHPGTDLLEAPLEIAPLLPGEEPQVADPTHLEGGRITVGHEIRKLCLVSDNPAFNRLFDLVGHEALNRRMHALGLGSAVLNHRLSEPRALPDSRMSAAVQLHPRHGPPISLPARTSRWELTNAAPALRVGRAVQQGDRLVPGPMDFTRRNGMSLRHLQDLLVHVCRPDLIADGPRLELGALHRAALLDALTRYPRESPDPLYPGERYPDAHVKFLLPGVRRVFPEVERGRRVEIAAKIGQAYGFTIENSYLWNPANGRSVFVAAVLYTNADGVLNDDRYEYGTVAEPFLADLGEWVARRWLADRR